MPTVRQSQVLKLIAAGRTTKEMSFDLGLSGSTVRKHITLLMRHYDVHNRASLVRSAIAAGDLHATTRSDQQ